MPNFSLSSSLAAAVLLVAASFSASAQSLLPRKQSETVKLNTAINFPRGEMSGICALLYDGGTLKGCVFNEFGISALDFTYCPGTKKAKIVHAASMLNKWYIKRVLSRDLAAVLKGFERGDSVYTNAKRHIVYQFSTIPANDSKK